MTNALNAANLPTVEVAKGLAKRLRSARGDLSLTHAQALELVARQHGERDWNSFVAASNRFHRNNTKRPPAIGDAVSGRYLGKAFNAKVHSVSQMGSDGGFRLSVQLDEPVNVSAFASFDVLRHRISATLNRDGVTAEKISDGTPQMVLHW